ncbi:MAG TPA: hypothetical protein VFM30_09495, partial [Steroidobacteraceae bacterium]|nr:hypothetical protein [Steroidobacteraceae bacterium]
LAETYWSTGALDDALGTLDSANQSLAIAAEGGTGLRLGQLRLLTVSVERNADAGRFENARVYAGELAKQAAALRASEAKDSRVPVRGEILETQARALIAAAGGDWRAARALSSEGASRAEAIQAREGSDTLWKFALLTNTNQLKAESELALGDFASAEQSARAAKAAKDQLNIEPVVDGRTQAYLSTLLAAALAQQGRIAEAKAVIDPAVKFNRDLAARNQGDELQKLELAAALYAQALADPSRRAALLRESRGLLAGLPGPMKSLATVRTWTRRIQDASA